MPKLTALIVDDSAVYRKILSETLASFPDVELVGAVANAKFALDRMARAEVNLLTFNFDMPEAEVISSVHSFRKKFPDTKIIMISSTTRSGANSTLRALSEGAFAFVARPQTKDANEAVALLRDDFAPLITMLAINNNLLSRSGRFMKDTTGSGSLTKNTLPQQSPSESLRYDLVVLGISTGGPNALMRMLPKLPANFPLPVLIVQHMPPLFTEALAASLSKKCQLRVVEAAEGMPVQRGTVYLAPGGHQMALSKAGGNSFLIKINDDPPENNCRPAADYLFRSAAENCKGPVIGVIMTGMGCDGVKGLQLLKKQGAWVIAQNEASSVVFGMPMEAIKAGLVDVIAPLDRIAEEITKAALIKKY
ncbi:MAG: hypothetical protein A2X49_13120 [Lentisphaerae bacterium GWF2_52_8]|nr:MAG: hypothetical protein A2X49_13120 [Lentisphaerae bacterium GWF2_52_8]